MNKTVTQYILIGHNYNNEPNINFTCCAEEFAIHNEYTP